MGNLQKSSFTILSIVKISIHILTMNKESGWGGMHRKKLEQLGVHIFDHVGSYVRRAPPLLTREFLERRADERDKFFAMKKQNPVNSGSSKTICHLCIPTSLETGILCVALTRFF